MPKNDVIVEIQIDGVWTDITGNNEVFTDSPITITMGQSDEDGGFRPSQISMRLDNSSDKYRISNPQSPFYRKIGRNTPIRVYIGTSIRCIAEINSWRCDETRDFRATPRRGKAWVDITASGVLYRVNKWTKYIRSSLYRYISRAPLSGDPLNEYWDMEVPSDGYEARSAVGGSSLVQATETKYTLSDGSTLPPGGIPSFGTGNKVPGSAPLPGFQNGGTLQGPVRTQTYDGYAIDWLMQFEANTDEGGTTSCDVLKWYESGTYKEFTVNVVKNSVTVFHANEADAATLSFTGSASIGQDLYDGSLHHFRYQVKQNGANYDATLYIDSSQFDLADNFGPAMVGTVGVPTSIHWNPGEDRGDYMPIACGHLAIWASGQSGFQPPVYTRINGQAGEVSVLRAFRILGEEGITLAVNGDFTQSTPMGPQRPDTLFNHVYECRTTEDGIIYDDKEQLRVIFKIRDARFNDNVSMVLYPTDFPTLPVEITDDTDIHNVVTVYQRDGGEATAEDSTSYLGTQSPPDGVGEEKDELTVNLYEPTYGDLQQYANWWMRRGTVDQPRYPEVTLDLNASPHLVTAANNLFPGDVIEIMNMRENTIRLRILGWTETIGTHSRSMKLICKPDQQFNIGTYSDLAVGPTTASRRYDSFDSELKAAVDRSAVSLVFRTLNLDGTWSTTSVPYDVMIEGERITVNSITSPSLVSGEYDQTATVTRSVNGVFKALSATSAIHVFDQGRYGL